MKNILFLLIFSSTIWSCSNQNNDNIILSNTTSKKNNLISQINTTKIQVNTNFPFGCANLKKIKYPKHWDEDLENYGFLKMPEGQEFDDIQKYFKTINFTKTVKSPRPSKLELLEIGDVFKKANNLNKIMQKSIDSCRYRLPNIGIYECYYSYNRYGNLILINPKTNTGKLLNIYADDLGGDSHTILRYFYIDKNEISIYEAKYFDTGCSLDEKYKIIINSDGELNINTLTK